MRGRKIRSMALVGAGVLSLMTGVAVAPASAQPCGYSESGGSAWYNHCTSDGSVVQVMLVYTAGGDSGAPVCMHPGLTKIGPSWLYKNAYYVGKLC
jgi:hypothetical protein